MIRRAGRWLGKVAVDIWDGLCEAWDDGVIPALGIGLIVGVFVLVGWR